MASVATNQARRAAVLHVLETTIINWQKQIKTVIKNEPQTLKKNLNFYTQDEIQIWTSRINKLNNLIVQLDASYVKDIVTNLQSNNSVYVQSFLNLREDIQNVIKN